jgi:hypothetical protein
MPGIDITRELYIRTIAGVPGEAQLASPAPARR